MLKSFGKSICYNATQIHITQLNTQSFPQHINYIEIRSNTNFSNTYNVAKIEHAHIISIQKLVFDKCEKYEVMADTINLILLFSASNFTCGTSLALKP